LNVSLLKQFRHHDFLLEKTRRDFLAFTKATYPEYQENWHHVYLSKKLEQWAFGDIDRMMVFMPPRSGKSELVSRRLPAYILGREPDAQIIATSYGSDLAQRMNRDVQRIIDTPEYQQLFPYTKLSGTAERQDIKHLRNTSIFEVVGHKGAYISAGVGGAITGMGFDYGIIDDPYKNRAEANSETIRRNIWEWFISTFYTRKQGKGKILITMTRWHESDLAGMLLFLQENDPTADKWDIICFPAISETNDEYRGIGDALWPERFPLADLMKTKSMLGSYDWAALYQQHPSPMEGGYVKRSWFKFYNVIPAKLDEVIQSWDLSMTGNHKSDFVVGQVWGRVGADRYLLDQVRERLDFVETIKVIRTLSDKWPQATLKVIEDKANGPAVVSSLKHEIAGIVPFNPQGEKGQRVNAVSPMIEAGNVFLPLKAPWIHDFIEEVITFPNAANDDQVDAMTQALLRFTRNKGILALGRSAFGI
jgi:predicted phage terminase large subunit-like protein